MSKSMDSIASGLATSTLGLKKIKIQQSIPIGSIKKGPHKIIRSADLNEGIEIKRRFGEGAKPLFARDDIAVNQTTIDGQCSARQSFVSKSHRKSLSTDSSSPERYRQRENKQHSCSTSSQRKSPVRSRYSDNPNQNRDKHVFKTKFSSTKTDRYKRSDKTKSRSQSPLKYKPREKIAYYRDDKRERDRLIRLYGSSRSRSPVQSARKIRSPIRKRRSQTPPRRRSTKREMHNRYSPIRSSKRDYSIRRTPTPPRIQPAQSHEHHKHSDKDLEKRQNVHSNSVATNIIPATPQYIPIPVAVPADYGAYSFPAWPSLQPPWRTSHRPPPPSHFAPFSMWPMMPPMRAPHQAPFIGIPPNLSFTPIAAQYRPRSSQRYPSPMNNTNNYQPRPRKT